MDSAAGPRILLGCRAAGERALRPLRGAEAFLRVQSARPRRSHVHRTARHRSSSLSLTSQIVNANAPLAAHTRWQSAAAMQFAPTISRQKAIRGKRIGKSQFGTEVVIFLREAAMCCAGAGNEAPAKARCQCEEDWRWYCLKRRPGHSNAEWRIGGRPTSRTRPLSPSSERAAHSRRSGPALGYALPDPETQARLIGHSHRNGRENELHSGSTNPSGPLGRPSRRRGRVSSDWL